MLPHASATRQPATAPVAATTPATSVAIGVGIDTSRYGHYAAFLHADLQPAAAELQFVESGAGYAQLRQRLEQLAARHRGVHFLVRLDAAGQYADNLLHFLHSLADAAGTRQIANATFTISCGDPQRNKNYRAAIFGTQKSDPIEARAAARFAITEWPAPTKAMPAPLRTVRQVAGRLHAVVRQRTRLINQFHHLLALAFPELALLVKDIALGWVLELCTRYPTAKRLAAATSADLQDIPYLPHALVDRLLEHAQTSVASLDDHTVAELVRDQVRQLRDVAARQKRLENLMVQAYRLLPEPNYLDTIPGIGAVTAAILTAFILDIDRFETPNQLVKYFGTLPIEASSGVDRDGKPRGPKRYVMSSRGNDLVRRYLWMAGLSAVRFNPAVRALYARVVAKHLQQKAIAIGHAMRKLLHLAFAIWKSGKPFDPAHYPWDTPAHVADGRPCDIAAAPAVAEASSPNRAAGLTQTAEPAQKEVTAARALSVPEASSVGERTFVDFAHIKGQLSMTRVLDQLGVSSRLRGAGAQQRCPCPIHRGDGRGRTFSVNLDENVFQCFDARCGKKGDVVDLWAALHQLSLRAAALDLVQTFHLEPSPPRGTGKRHG
jgi:transposase